MQAEVRGPIHCGGPIERITADVEQRSFPWRIPDDQLRLIFTCCHPALSREAQVALTLRTLGGLSVAEIAHAFLVADATIAQRLARAKQNIARAHIPYEIPDHDSLAPRLDAVLSVLYLVFNAGYLASSHPELVRTDLVADASRLARGLSALLPEEPEPTGLLALMLLHDSRSDARVGDEDELVLLEDQDRGQCLRLLHAGTRCLRGGSEIPARARLPLKADSGQ